MSRKIGTSVYGVPGQLDQSSKVWHEVIDEQWRPHYSRRPPSFMADLHDLIRDLERTQTRSALAGVPPLKRPQVKLAPLTQTETLEDLKTRKAMARKDVPLWRRAERKARLASAIAEHESWLSESEAQRIEAQKALQQNVNLAFQAWLNGSDLAATVVLTASFEAEGLSAIVAEIADNKATILVLVPKAEETHPEKPSRTASGQKTVSKRTKSERAEAHRLAIASDVYRAMRLSIGRAPHLRRIRTVAVVPDPNSELLATSLVVLDFQQDKSWYGDVVASAMDDDGRLSEITNSITSSKLRNVGDLLPELFENLSADALAIETNIESSETLLTPDFWIQLQNTIDQVPEEDT